MLAASFSAAALSGCALLPAEDANRAVPTVAARESESYNMVVVTRTDIVNSKTIYCSYSQLDSVNLSFETGGKKYGRVYVRKGSRVQKGDLLATLDMGDLFSEISALEQSISEHEKTLSQAKEITELEQKKINVKYQYGMITEAQKNAELEKVAESYNSSVGNLEETLYLEKLEYETLLTKQQNSSIYATIDGIVSYVSSEFSNSSKTSVQGKTMITLIDDTECAFQASTPLRSYYNDGETITITMTKGGSGEYNAVIKFDPDNEELMYLYPTEEITDLEIGARASFTLILDSRENVLAVANGAIRSAKDFKYVYYINDDGIRDMKIVETGLVGDSLTEITSGLEFGEAVIK